MIRRQPRLPLDPLVRMYGGVSTLAMALGRHRRQVSEWQNNGIPVLSADRVAVSLGMHPIEVWPDWYEVDTAA